MNVLDDYFIPKSNVAFERHLFRQIAQESDETVDQFVCKLRQQATSCDFRVWEDNYIRDQVIDKCYSSHLRRKFLEQESSVTLDCLLKIARAQEAISRQLREMEQNSNPSHVNAIGGKNSKGAWNSGGEWNARGATGGKKPKICFGCGSERHFTGDKSCPARDQAWRKCGKLGHFQIKCMQSQRGGVRRFESGKGGAGKASSRTGCSVSNKANSVGCEAFSTSGERQSPGYAFTVSQITNHLSSDNGVETLNVRGVDLPETLIDSGAMCNLMGQQT